MDNTQALDLSAINYKEKSKNKKIYFIAKRLFDILISLVGIIVLIPVTIIVKLVYVLSGDMKSIFYVQERIGKNGKKFNLYKFRTMIPDADGKLEQILKNDKKLYNEYKKNKKLENDPRITKIGKFLRKGSIDEFPQFINIFLGQMTVVGPRPYLEREKKDMGKAYNTIIKSKPGLTGLWQVSGRSNVDFESRIKIDEKYELIKGMKTDLKIFCKTFLVVFEKNGAK